MSDSMHLSWDDTKAGWICTHEQNEGSAFLLLCVLFTDLLWAFVPAWSQMNLNVSRGIRCTRAQRASYFDRLTFLLSVNKSRDISPSLAFPFDSLTFHGHAKGGRLGSPLSMSTCYQELSTHISDRIQWNFTHNFFICLKSVHPIIGFFISSVFTLWHSWTQLLSCQFKIVSPNQTDCPLCQGSFLDYIFCHFKINSSSFGVGWPSRVDLSP